MTTTPLARRLLAAAVLALGLGAASLAQAPAALADSEVGLTTGGPLLEAPPSAPGTGEPSPAEPVLPEAEPVLPAEEELPIDGCIGDACSPDEGDGEWTELDSGCFSYSGNPGYVYCPGEEHPVPLDEDGCYFHDDHVYCLDEPPGGHPEPCVTEEGDSCPVTDVPDCPVTHVSEDCLRPTPDDEPGDEPGDRPDDEPGDTPADEPADKPRPAGGLPLTGPGLALVAGTGVLLTAVGAGGLLLYRRRTPDDDTGSAE